MSRKYDNTIIIIIIIISIFLFLCTPKNFFNYIYLLSLIWYFIVLFKFGRVEVLSITGMYILYMFFFVQLGVILQYFYFPLNTLTNNIILLYNFIFPVIISIYNRYIVRTYVKKLRLKCTNSSTINFIFFLLGIILLTLFFVISGGIVLLMQEAESKRVAAIAGKGFIVISALQFLAISIFMENNQRIRNLYILLAVIFIFGTGYRGPAMNIIVVSFIIFYIHEGKISIKEIVLFGVFLMLMYSVIGVIRQGLDLKALSFWSTYKPFMWRLYVNTLNFNTILDLYPTNMFMYGRTYINDLLTLLPGAQKSYMLTLKDILSMKYQGGSLTPTIFGESYINFGIGGAIIIPILYGIALLFLDGVLRTRINYRIYYYIGLILSGVSTSGIMPVILYSLMPALFIYYVYTSLIAILKTKRVSVGYIK